MTNVTVRKRAGAAIVAIPAEVLEALHIKVGSKLDFKVTDGVVTVQSSVKGRGYPLLDLLQGQVKVMS